MAILNIVHKTQPRATNNSNTYTFSRIANHNIIIIYLPSSYYNNNNAATVASNIRQTFPSIQLYLIVSISSGVPTKVNIRLSDVIISKGIL